MWSPVLGLVVILLTADGLSATLDRSGDKVTIAEEDDNTVVQIESASGIGAATVKRGPDGWPKRLQIDLNLKGLEGFTLSQGDLRLRSFLGAKEAEVHRRTGKTWVPIAGKHEKLAPRIEQAGERIVIDLPEAWLQDAHDSLRIEWVDFYRN